MKRRLLIFVTILLAISTLAHAETFQLHSGVQFGMSMDKVKQLETIAGYTVRESRGSFYGRTDGAVCLSLSAPNLAGVGGAVYINDLLKVFKTFFAYTVREGHIHINPTAGIKNVKQPKVKIITFSELEIRRILNYYHGRDYLSTRNRTMIALFFDTGMRLNEVMTLCPEQIRDDHILVHGKGNKERMVPVSPYLAKALMQFQIVRGGYLLECKARRHASSLG